MGALGVREIVGGWSLRVGLCSERIGVVFRRDGDGDSAGSGV